jgi:hypothetical protein
MVVAVCKYCVLVHCLAVASLCDSTHWSIQVVVYTSCQHSVTCHLCVNEPFPCMLEHTLAVQELYASGPAKQMCAFASSSYMSFLSPQ